MDVLALFLIEKTIAHTLDILLAGGGAYLWMRQGRWRRTGGAMVLAYVIALIGMMAHAEGDADLFGPAIAAIATPLGAFLGLRRRRLWRTEQREQVASQAPDEAYEETGDGKWRAIVYPSATGTGFSEKALIGMAVVTAAVLGAAMFRFEAVPNPRGYIFLQDRLFGQHRLCYPSDGGLKCEPLLNSTATTGLFDHRLPN